MPQVLLLRGVAEGNRHGPNKARLIMSNRTGGPWYIDTDGKTILEWTCCDRRGTIALEDGRILHERKYLNPGRIFASHPDDNPNIRKDSDGVYHCEPKPYPYHEKDDPLTAYSFKEGGGS